jgi:hypothetical protein
METPRRCVYTTLTGDYERLNEQPMAAQSAMPFICLTDDPDLKSGTWQIRRVAPLFGMDPIRSQRDLKIRPHIHVRDFDASLYIDNTVLLTQPPESVFERLFPASGFAVPRHSFRESVLDEFLEVARLGYDDQGRIFEQLNHYAVDCPGVLQDHPYWTGLLLRDHRNPAVQAMLEIWMAHVHRYSRRDQLSIVTAFRQAGLTPDALDIDNHSSWFHTWPHSQGRDREQGMRLPSTSFSPPVAQIRRLELTVAEFQERGRIQELTVAELQERGRIQELAVTELLERLRVQELTVAALREREQVLESQARRGEEALAEQELREELARSRTLRGMGRRVKGALKRGLRIGST